jgi:hypothetical protein
MNPIKQSSEIINLPDLGFVDGREVAVLIDNNSVFIAKLQDITESFVENSLGHTHTLDDIIAYGARYDKSFLSTYNGGTWLVPQVKVAEILSDSYLNTKDWLAGITSQEFKEQLSYYKEINYDGNSSNLLYRDFISGVLPGSYCSCVLLLDGRAAFIPSGISPILYLSLTNFELEESVLELSSMQDSFCGGVLLKNGFLCLIPKNETKILVVDPYTDTLANQIHDSTYLTGNSTFKSGILTSTSKVFLVPDTSTFVVVYNPMTNTLSVDTATIESAKWSVVALLDGKILGISEEELNHFVFDDEKSSGKTTRLQQVITNGCTYCSVLFDGTVLCLPGLSSSTAIIFDTSSNTVEFSSCDFPAGKYNRSFMLPDSRVFLASTDTFSPAVYDPNTDTLAYYPESLDATSFSIAMLLPGGSILLVSPTENRIRCYYTSPWVLPFVISILTSPTFSKS